MTNKCTGIPGKLEGCCCNEDMCLDPANDVYYPQHKNPPGTQMCYVGIQLPDQSLPNGASMACSGSCANTTITVKVANKKSKFTIYTCDGLRICGVLGIEGTCGNDDNDAFMHGCCCRGSKNCNAPAGLSIPPSRRETTDFNTTCFVGAAMKDLGGGNPIGAPMPCNGACANYTVGGFSVFACDPLNVCSSMGLSGNEFDQCKMDDTMKLCCCTSPFCNIESVNGQPSKKTLRCFAGFSVGGLIPFNKGVQQECPYGMCANATVSVAGIPLSLHTCEFFSLCPALNISRQCNNPDGIPNVKGCCCDDSNYCNIPNVIPPTAPPSSKVIQCFQGFSLTGKHRIGADIPCAGYCARYNLGATAVLYTCDPIGTCDMLNAIDDCRRLGNVRACCCSFDHCNDVNSTMTTQPPPPPSNLTCYVGLARDGQIIGGDDFRCDGMCANITTQIGSHSVTAFMCDPIRMCKKLNLNGQCMGLGNNLLQGCCCDQTSNCNLDEQKYPRPPKAPKSTKPIVCPEGIWIAGQSLADPRRMVGCRGDCGSIQLNIPIPKQNFSVNAQLYMCDPANLCKAANLTNTCGTIPGIGKACCCNSDMCMDPANNYTTPTPSPPVTPAPMRECFVGFTFNRSTIGDRVKCDGMCANITTRLNGSDVTAYMCDPIAICSGLQLVGKCKSAHNGSLALKGCCCNNANECNYNGPTKIYSTVPSSSKKSFACPEGIWVGKMALGADPNRIGPCHGDCASLTLNEGTIHTNLTEKVALYMCDPATLCKQMKISNQCKTIPDLGSVCCCNSNMCLNPSQGQTAPPTVTTSHPHKVPECFAGFSVNGKIIGGDRVKCDGMCANISTNLNGNDVTAYMCDPISLCNLLHLDETCINSTSGSLFLKGCCCDTASNCNSNGTVSTRYPTVPSISRKSFACPEGIWYGKKNIAKDPSRIGACHGDCASLTINPGVAHSNLTKPISLYMCDPAALCKAMNVANSCSNIPRLGTVCCCNSNMCLNPSQGVTSPIITTTPTSGSSAVGVSFAVILATLFFVLRN
ncbi:hypothetical protein L596_011885 [Steinernema carpocapsae]|uniref:ET module n=1 Tax=Steinernema carpocapsae TaxID=34508 RepID=A0A4U5NVM1_STECR|nr:hypothetical protein L596_011885 [Steinernema carpocapsae]